MAIVSALVIAGTTIPVAYDGYNLSENKVWSQDTGRTNTAEMQGTLLAIKRKIEVTLTPMSLEKAKQIKALISSVSNPWVTVLYNDLGTQGEFTGYFGDVTFPVKGTGINNGKGLVVGMKFSVIEK